MKGILANYPLYNSGFKHVTRVSIYLKSTHQPKKYSVNFLKYPWLHNSSHTIALSLFLSHSLSLQTALKTSSQTRATQWLWRVQRLRQLVWYSLSRTHYRSRTLSFSRTPSLSLALILALTHSRSRSH